MDFFFESTVKHRISSVYVRSFATLDSEAACFDESSQLLYLSKERASMDACKG